MHPTNDANSKTGTLGSEASRRQLLGGFAALSGLSAFGLPVPVLANDNSIVSSNWGGEWLAWLKAHQDQVFKNRYNGTVTVDPSADNSARLAKIKLGLPQKTYDVVTFADSFFARADAEGIIQAINYESPNFDNVKDVDKKFLQPSYVSWGFNGFGLGYIPNSTNAVPKRWADMWKPEYQGKIALPGLNHSFGLHVLFVCAVAGGKDWKDTEAGFEMLKRLVDQRPNWYLDSVGLTRAYADGEVAIGWLGKGEYLQLIDGGTEIGLAIPEEGGMYTMWGYAPVTSTSKLDLVEKYLNSTLDPEVQAATAEKWGFHPTNRRWREFAKPEVIKRVSWSDEDLARLIDLDHKWINDRRTELVDKMSRIIK